MPNSINCPTNRFTNLNLILDCQRRPFDEQQTDAFKQEMHRRNGIEATVSELARGYGLRHCRYRGLKKTQLQSSMAAAACNITRWSVRNNWEMNQIAA